VEQASCLFIFQVKEAVKPVPCLFIFQVKEAVKPVSCLFIFQIKEAVKPVYFSGKTGFTACSTVTAFV
jgi:hypothetical protein